MGMLYETLASGRACRAFLRIMLMLMVYRRQVANNFAAPPLVSWAQLKLSIDLYKVNKQFRLRSYKGAIDDKPK